MCIPPICYGASSVSVNAAKANANGDFASVALAPNNITCKIWRMTSPAEKWRSAADAVAAISSGMKVAIGTFSAEPLVLTTALWERAAELADLTVVSGMLMNYSFLKSRPNIRLRTWFMPGTLLKESAGKIDAEFIPLTSVQAVRYFESAKDIDVALVQVSPANADGLHSFGINTSNTRAMVNAARFVIAEVNEDMPFTLGDSLVHESELDLLVASNRTLPDFPNRPATDEADIAIGQHVAQLVGDGSTVQVGIGSIPGAVVDGLIQLKRKNLFFISLLSDPVRKLIEAGCCVEQNPKAVVVQVMGTRELYRWVAHNPAIALVDALTTHSLEKLHARKNMVSVNSALDIDLFGQVNSEMLDGRQAGGIGGSMDFAMGAQFEGSLSIFAMRSTTTSGASKILPRFKGGAPVTIPRSLVHIVVTEHGVADLRNLSVRERALALANIAHPTHRPGLLDAAASL